MTSAVLSAALLGVAARGWIPGALACFALVPLLLVLRHERRPLRAAALTAIASLGELFAAFEGAIPAIPWAFPLAVGAAALAYGVPGFLVSRLLLFWPSSTVLWALPISWTATEFVAGSRWLWGQFASPVALGYSQADSPFLALAGISSVTGVTLLVLVINVVTVRVFLMRRPMPLLLFPLFLLASFPWSTGEVNAGAGPVVAVVQPAIHPAWYETSGSVVEARAHVLNRLAGLTNSAVPEARLVVWPEGAVPTGVDELSIPFLLPGIELGSFDLLAGAITFRDGKRFNSLVHVQGQGAEAVFDKLAPVPLGERGISAGRALVVGRWAGAWIGPLICLDSVYSSFARKLAGLDAEILVVASDDSFSRGMSTPALHFRASIFRAVETGLPLVFASAAGPSAVVAPNGRILAEAVRGEPAVLRTRVPPAGRSTLFVAVGNWVGISCLVISLFLAVATLPAVRGS